MRLKKARVIGFQSFADTGDIEFEDGFNLIVGQNNSGKSAFLKALGHSLPDNRHRTPEVFQEAQLPNPETEFEIAITGTEFKEAIYKAGQTLIELPLRSSWVQADMEPFADSLFGDSELRAVVRRIPHNAFKSLSFSGRSTSPEQLHFQCAFNPSPGKVNVNLAQSNSENSGNLLNHSWISKVFSFNAERMAIGEYPQGSDIRLEPNAANLPRVLQSLAGGYGDLFKKLVEHVREIFATIGNISTAIPPSPGNTVQVRVWPTESMPRPELSFPLNESGTGVAQVLAILTAIMTLENAVIIIDEINSFLHPAAVKALIKIIQDNYSHHQYIISTHALEMLSYCEPSTIHLVRREGYVSKIKRLDLKETRHLLEIADEVGFSMADVMGADRIIWVEGETEQDCFEQIYKAVMAKRLPRGTNIKAVVDTGRFGRKSGDQKLIYDVYQRLSVAGNSVLTNVLFSFDRETQSDDRLKEIQKTLPGKIHFLPRRHFECYLINPAAIAALINKRDHGRETDLKPDDVAAKICELAVTVFKVDLSDPDWQRTVDAANLIDATMKALTESRVMFNKRKDSRYLVDYISENDRASIKELIDYVLGLISNVTDDTVKSET